jgi:hypothetical protein
MKHMILALLVVVASVGALAQEAKKPSGDEVMAMYIDMAKPVAGHERLRSFTGRWDVTQKFWMDPTQPPQTFTGTANGRMVLGGRFLQLDGKTTGGMESESLTIMGFDRRSDDYTMVGYDTLGTYYITAAGKPGNDGIVLHGSYLQPPHGGEQKYRFVWKNPTADSHTMDLYFALPDGKEMKVAEMAYRRAKS